MLNRISNVLSKGLFNMDAIAILTAMYIALWFGVYKDDLKRDFGLDKPKVEQTETKDGNAKNN